MNQETPRLNLRESFHTYLEKAKVLNAHLSEDWPELSQRCRYEELPQQLSRAITEAESALHIHRQEWRGESPEQKLHRSGMKEMKELYRETYDTITYFHPSETKTEQLIKEYGPRPKKKDIPAAFAIMY